jgi:hypothetical protein
MKNTILGLVTSKKFLAAVTAMVVYVAGRFGFDVDPATLDRIYLALLAFVGAQGIADSGKEAAKIWVGSPAQAPDSRPPGVEALSQNGVRRNPPPPGPAVTSTRASWPWRLQPSACSLRVPACARPGTGSPRI